MRKTILLAAMLAMAAMMVAAPLALAADRDNRHENRIENRIERFFDDDGFFFNPFDDFFFDRDRDFDHDFFFNGGGDGFGDFEQDADSGDIDQSFDVTGGGDNSNQCVSVQGVSNTGNAQNQIGVIQYGSEADDFGFEDSGASINVSPNSFTSCDQQVNQAASAFGGR